MNIKIKIIFLSIFSILFFSACSQKESTFIDSNIAFKNSKILKENQLTKDDYEDFLANYFKPWDLKELSYSKKEAMWGNFYKSKKIYLENLQLANKQWFDEQIDNANFQEYNSLIKRAITIKNSHTKVFPTNSMMFYNPKLQGEGFPFDYNQNSSIKINTPILVSHLSKDKQWAFIQTSSFIGFISLKDIAFVDEEFISKFKTQNYFVATKDNFPLFKNEELIENIKLGTIFPFKENKLLFANKQKIDYFELNENIEKMPLQFSSENTIKILSQLINQPYGWGGILGNRDCSSFTQDFFKPFGKFLSRNSKSQTQNGLYIDISNLSNSQKKEFIRKNAIPYLTLVYLKGHIMLYVGLKENEPIVAHNLWSIRLKNFFGLKSRHLVGKSIISTLDVGKELNNFDEKNSILTKIQGIVFL